MENRSGRKIVGSHSYLLCVIFFLFACEQATVHDAVQPDINIISPSQGDTVMQEVLIEFEIINDDLIDKVDLYVDDEFLKSKPGVFNGEFIWNTTIYPLITTKEIQVRARDKSWNIGHSQPVFLIIDNSMSFPLTPMIDTVTFQNNAFDITWMQSRDIDFHRYSLFHSYVESFSDSSEIFTTDDISDTTFYFSDVELGAISYFKLLVEDLFGYHSTSEIKSGKAYFTFEKYYEEAAPGRGLSVIKTHDGGYALTGYRSDGMVEKYILKTNHLGEQEWIQFYGNGIANCITQASDHDYIITGRDGDNMFVIKTDSSGIVVWEENYLDASGWVVYTTSDNSFIIAGTKLRVPNFPEYPPFNDDAIVIKFDNSGAVLWERSYSINNPYYSSSINSILELSTAGYVFAGRTWSNETDHGNRIWILEVDASGTVDWDITWSRFHDFESANRILQTQDGGFVLCGTMENNAGREALLLRLDADGTELWVESFNEYSNFYDISLLQDGSFLCTGSNDEGSVLVTLINEDGVVERVWQPSEAFDWYRGRSHWQNDDNTVAIAGYTNTGTLFLIQTHIDEFSNF